MKAVIYARYSSDSQREESIEGQIRCNELCGRKWHHIIGTYIDRALPRMRTARSFNLIKTAQGHFRCGSCLETRPLFPDRYDSAHYKHVLKQNGVNGFGKEKYPRAGGIILNHA